MSDRLMSLVERIAFWTGLAIVAVAFVEGLLQLFGVSLTSYNYSDGRLLEFATMVFVVVAAINLRSIRAGLRDRI